MFAQTPITAYQRLSLPIESDSGISITIKRIDQVHPTISGNKWFKLKYNLIEAKSLGYSQLLSFGGAYSNHIDALAHAAYDFGFESIGIIRGDELAGRPLNPTLSRAQALDMRLEFISRADYRLKHTDNYTTELQARYPNAYIIPEGGSNALAVKGCEEMLTEADQRNFDVIVCAVGTGGTFSGLINASGHGQSLIGFSALKGDFLTEPVQGWTGSAKHNWAIYDDSLFGGYGKFNKTLEAFIELMNKQYELPLEPIYTGKAFYRMLAMIEQGNIAKGSRILFMHTGGLQAFDRSK